MKKENIPNQDIITRDAFPASQKIYVKGRIHDIQVPMREISLEDTVHKLTGNIEQNPSVTVYDTSGPYTDPSVTIDITKGIDRSREHWIKERGDVQELKSISSDYGLERLQDQGLDALRFPNLLHRPLVAKKGKNVSQMYYAKKGIITAEMEYRCDPRKSTLREELTCKKPLS